MSWQTLKDAGFLDEPPTAEQVDDAGINDEDYERLVFFWTPTLRAAPTHTRAADPGVVYDAPHGKTRERRPREPAASPAAGLGPEESDPVQDPDQAAEEVAKDYDPNQPRDEGGKWSSTGGGTSISDGGPETGGGGASSTSPSTFKPQPTAHVREAANTFNAERNLPPVREATYVEVDEPRAQSIAEAYDAMPANDNSPETKAAYAALGREVEEQWRYAEDRMGMTMESWTKEGQPYANSQEMRDDVANNKHLYFFTGGEPHPYLGKVGPDGLSANDKFRAVHDLFGHAAEGYGFGSRGEENAWLVHSQMFSPEAQRAMTSETRGQNSWVNFGKQNYNADGSKKDIPATEKPYAVQKAALLPAWASDWRQVLPKKSVRLDPDTLRRAQRRGVVYVHTKDREYVRDELGQFAETGGGDGMRASDFEGTGHNSVAENSMDKVGELIEEAGGGIFSGYESEQAAAAKAEVAEHLSTALEKNPDWQQYLTVMHASGAGDQKASALVHRWAMSSSDTSEESLLLQAMAAEEFGLKDYRDAGLNGGGPNSLFDPMSVDSVADRVVYNSLGTIANAETARETVKNGYRAFVREMYTQTQADLAAQGITSVYLVRGVATDHPLGANQITLHPMSSFSTDVNTARNFAGSTAIFAKVPASQVISTPRTGFGCLSEHEVVVLGGTINAVVLDRHLTYNWSNQVAAALRETEKPKKAATVKDAPIQVDGTLADADWTKTAWDLPPYKSPEFMRLVPDLDIFRTLPVYQHAVASGLITNDEWTGDDPDITKALTKYSDDQPRDEHGRWTGGGGGSSGGISPDTEGLGTAFGGNESPFAFSENAPPPSSEPPPNVDRAALQQHGPNPEGRPAAPDGTPKNPLQSSLTQQEKVEALAALSQQNKELIDPILASVNETLGATGNTSIKSEQSLLGKANRPSIVEKKPYWNVEYVADSFRFKTVLDDVKQADQALGMLMSEAEAAGQPISIIKADVGKLTLPNGDPPSEWGWRVLPFDLRMPNGQIAEYYMAPKELDDANFGRRFAGEYTDRGGLHQAFETWRYRNNDDLSDNELGQLMGDMRISREGYSQAWNTYLERTGHSNEEVLAAARAVGTTASRFPKSMPEPHRMLQLARRKTMTDKAPIVMKELEGERIIVLDDASGPPIMAIKDSGRWYRNRDYKSRPISLDFEGFRSVDPATAASLVTEARAALA